MASDGKPSLSQYKLQAEIQKTHVTILENAGKDKFNYQAAVKAQLNFDKIARKFLVKYKCEEKMLKHGVKDKITIDVFRKDFEKEFIPEFSDKVFDVIYDYNKNKRKKKKNKNLLGINDVNNNNNDDVKESDGKEEAANDDNNKEEEKTISRMDAQRFLKSQKDVRKHIREKSLVPLESIFTSTQFSDIDENVSKVSFEKFQTAFEEKLGKEQCKIAFDLMKDEKGEVSIVAYNNFRDKGVHQMLGDAGKLDEDDKDDNEEENNDETNNDDNNDAAAADANTDDKAE